MKTDNEYKIILTIKDENIGKRRGRKERERKLASAVSTSPVVLPVMNINEYYKNGRKSGNEAQS
jgi:hypothetical protein